MVFPDPSIIVCNGTHVRAEVGQGRGGYLAPVARRKSLALEDLRQKGFLRLLDVLSGQPATWTCEPGRLGHGLEKMMLEWGMPSFP